MVYEVRFFFDPGSGVCFWSNNEATEEKFGNYPVECDQLPLSENLKRKLLYLIYWYDTRIDWSYPPDPTPWDLTEQKRFDSEVAVTIKKVKKELGSNFVILEEYNYL